MDELDKNIPDDFWRKAFDEAAETPPLRVWDSIERRLDQSNDTKIIPLWGLGLLSSRPFAWSMGVAAAVTLLLIGWWAGSTQTPHQQPISVAQHIESTDHTERMATKPVNPADGEVNNLQKQHAPAIASVTKPLESSENVSVRSSHPSMLPSVDGQTKRLLARLKNTTSLKSNELENRVAALSIERSFVAPAAPNEAASLTSGRSADSPFAYTHSLTAKVTSVESTELAAYELLSGKSLRFRDLGQIHRIVWFRPSELPSKPEVLKSKQKMREVWASASVMPGSFNPMVSVQTASFSSANYASADALKNLQTASSSPTINSRPNFSMAYQAGVGVQVNDHWSFESGIGYLSGRSTVESPTQIPTASLVAAGRNTTSGNQYVDALKSSIHNSDYAFAPQASSNNISNSAYQQTYTSTRQALTNDYQYMQVPLQVGYQLRPRKRLGLALLGGFITNIFVRNTVGNEVVITAKDGVYRPLSLAAMMGARLRYRPTQQWSASLAGVYQPSLGSGTHLDSQVQSHPTSTGMSFGVDYHF